MKYTLINEEKYFFRKESTGAGILCINEYGYQIFLNRTGSLVLELLKEFTDSDDVLNEMTRMFPNIQKMTLNKDLKEVLDLFKLYDLIDFEEKINEIDFGLSFAGDSDYRAVSSFVVKNFKNNIYNFSQVNATEYFAAVSLRYRTFHSQEYYIIKKMKGNIVAVISILPPNGVSNVVTISGLFGSKILSTEDLKELLNDIILFITTKIKNQINKIRVNFLGDLENRKNSLLFELLQSIGFEKECLLKKEVENKDIIMVSKFI